MNDRDTMQLVLCALLLVSGLLRLLRRTLCRAQTRAALPAWVLFASFMLLSSAFCVVISRFMGLQMLLPALLLLVAFGTGAAALQGLSRLPGRRGLVAALLLLLWAGAFAAFTVLLRRPGDTGVLLRFDVLQDVLRHRSLSPLTDVLLNLTLFLPMGFLLPMADPEPWRGMMVPAAAPLVSAAAEGTLLLFSLGQADVEDLAANALGALIGCGISRLTRQLR